MAARAPARRYVNTHLDGMPLLIFQAIGHSEEHLCASLHLGLMLKSFSGEEYDQLLDHSAREVLTVNVIV
jgi:hypothetical protein